MGRLKKKTIYRSHHWGASQVALGPVFPEPHHYSQSRGCSPHFQCPPPLTQVRLKKKTIYRSHHWGASQLALGPVFPEPHHYSQFRGCSPHFLFQPPQTPFPHRGLKSPSFYKKPPHIA